MKMILPILSRNIVICITMTHQVTLLFKHWNEFGDVIIEYGTMKSPQCEYFFSFSNLAIHPNVFSQIP